MYLQRYIESRYFDGIYLNKEISFDFCGYYDCTAGHKFGPFVRSYHLIHYILNGKGWYEINNNRYNLEQGQGFLIPPKVETVYRADQKEPWSYIWIAFHGQSVEPLLESMGLSVHFPIFTYSGQADFKQMFLDVLQEPKEDLYLQQMRLLYTFLHEISLDLKTAAKVPGSNRQVYLKKATQFIRLQLHEYITVSSIAEHVGIDPNYLNRIFKKEYNVSVKEYILNMKIEAAKEMLKEKGTEIKYAANAVGYPDAFAFSRIFKQKTGLSPSEYRKLTGSPL